MKFILSAIVKVSCILGFFGLSACSVPQPLPPAFGGKDPRQVLAERVRAKPRLAVLFIGNSYSFGVPRAFSKIAKSHGKDVRTGQSTFGGWTLAKHAAYEPTLQQIRQGNWDIVVIQEHSETPALPPRKRDSQMFPPLHKLVEEVEKSGAIPVLYQTWGRRDGDQKQRKGDDFRAMTGRLRTGYHAAAENAGGLVVVPVGDAWEREISANPAAALFMPDGSHPTEVGNALTGLVFYQTIFGK